MLIQEIIGAVAAQFIESAFGFGSAKSCPVGVGLFRRLFSLTPLLETLQVDQIRHPRLHYRAKERHAAVSQRRELSRWACSVII
jgi:hypothetical protein